MLFLTRKWPPAVGGMEVYSRELASELRERVDLDLRVLAGREDGRPPSPLALAGFALRTALGLLWQRSSWDVIHGGDLAVWPLVWLAALRSPGSRAVLSAHGTDVAFAHRRGWAAFLYRAYLGLGTRLLPRVALLANSRATAALCKAAGFASVEVVPLATRPGGQGPVEIQPFILFFGRLMRKKGCAWFIREVLPLLPGELHLVVAGTVWDPEERKALSSPRVEYVGPVDAAERDRLCAAATAVVLPNIDAGMTGFEGFGLAAIEAAAAGGIVLAAELHGLTDAVQDGVTGFLLPAGGAVSWAAKIEEIGRWPDEGRRAFVARSRATVARDYSWPRVAERTVALYRCKAGNPGEEDGAAGGKPRAEGSPGEAKRGCAP